MQNRLRPGRAADLADNQRQQLRSVLDMLRQGSVRTGAAVRTVLSILGVCIPTSQQSCPHPPVTRIRPQWCIGATAPGAPLYRPGMTLRPRGEPQNPTTGRRAPPTLPPPSGQYEHTPGGTDRGAAGRDHTTPDPTDGTMSARSRILARVTAPAAPGVGGNSSDPVGSVASGPATGDAAKLEAADGNRFTPTTLEPPAGETVTIQITTTDDRAHDFAIEAADLNTATIRAGAAATATFTLPEATTQLTRTFYRRTTSTTEGGLLGGGTSHAETKRSGWTQ
jgi:plastocyanin